MEGLGFAIGRSWVQSLGCSFGHGLGASIQD